MRTLIAFVVGAAGLTVFLMGLQRYRRARREKVSVALPVALMVVGLLVDFVANFAR